MKRITKKRNSKKLRESVMTQMDKTRAEIEKDHPGLLASIRKFAEGAKTGGVTKEVPPQAAPKKKLEHDDIKGLDKAEKAAMFEEMLNAKKGADKKVPGEGVKHREKKPSVIASEEEVAIDRQKNLETILKFAASNPGMDMKKLKAELKGFLN